MKQREMDELLQGREDEIAARLVRFQCNIGRYVIQSARHQTDQFGQRHVDNDPDTGTLILDCDFGGKTKPYDPSIEPDATIIRRAREHMGDPRNAGEITRRKLCEVAPDAPDIPFDSWSEMKPSRIGEIVVEMGKDIDECIAFEESLGPDARKEVIAVLLDIRSGNVQERAADTTEPMIGD